MPWVEFNLHVIVPSFETIRDAILDFVEPFISENRSLFQHWHYMIEPKEPKEQRGPEIRLRFESEDLDDLRRELFKNLEIYANQSGVLAGRDEPLGSHEGCHGKRGETYQGYESEKNFGIDWKIIVEFWQFGSESAIGILKLGRGLKENYSTRWEKRCVHHRRYLHFPANQLIFE